MQQAPNPSAGFWVEAPAVQCGDRSAIMSLQPIYSIALRAHSGQGGTSTFNDAIGLIGKLPDGR
jgi:hypothetical protein